MNNIKLNQTPIRTSRNFGINNIEINDLKIPKDLREFKSVEIVKGNSEISNEVEFADLTYGTGKLLENNIKKNSNSKIKIVTPEKTETIKSIETVKITYRFDEDNLDLINYIEVVAASDLELVIEYISETDMECFHNGVINITSNENANVNIAVVNLLNEKSQNFEAFENTIYSNANLKYTIIDLGGNKSITNYYSNMLGQSSNNILKTIYLAKENEIKDINYIAELRGEKANIDIDVQGALKDNAKKNFKGTIDFKKGCKKAKGSENEYCLILSEEAKAKALPMLLCTEDDVEGSHSAASGKVDNKQLFYIMSRGISYKEAIKMIVNARFNKIVETIKDEDTKELIFKEIDRRLK